MSGNLRFITSNKNKVAEMSAKLAPLGYTIEQADLGYPEVQEDTLEKVVQHGLEHLRENGEDNILIEDSGLFIEALGDFPGVYSAYVFKAIGNQGVLKLMQECDERTARFEAVIGILKDGEIHMVKGVCPGTIATEVHGASGFGYDPVFIPDGETRAFGQMTKEEKNQYSHRGRATGELARLLEDIG